MNNLLLFILSILPALIILRHFYAQDKYNKEPLKLIARIFFLSAVITIPLAIAFQSAIDYAFGFAGILGIFVTAFISAALVEEYLKYWIVKKFAFPKDFFDEKVDGIIYAVAASLGFATVENILYVMFADESAFFIAVVRAFTAVPSHALDGAVIGYFLGIAKFVTDKKRQKKLILKGLLIAILFHGFYDFFLFTESILSFLIFPLLIIQFRLVRIGLRQIYMKNPPEKLSLEFRKLVAGLGFFDYIKMIVGVVIGIFSLLVLIGLSMQIYSGEVLINDSWIVVLIAFICIYLAYLLFRNVKNKLRVKN